MKPGTGRYELNQLSSCETGISMTELNYSAQGQPCQRSPEVKSNNKIHLSI